MFSHCSGNLLWQRELSLGERRIFFKQLATKIRLASHTSYRQENILHFRMQYPSLSFWSVPTTILNQIQLQAYNFVFAISLSVQRCSHLHKILCRISQAPGCSVALFWYCYGFLPQRHTAKEQNLQQGFLLSTAYSLSPEVSSSVTWRSSWYLQIRIINP